MPPGLVRQGCTAFTPAGYCCDCASGYGRPIAPSKLMQAAKEPDEYQNRDRYPEKPKQQIASHRQSSTLLFRELVAWREVPNSFSSKLCVGCGTKSSSPHYLLPWSARNRSALRVSVWKGQQMNQNPNQKPGQQQQGGQQQGGQQGGQQKPGQQQQGGQQGGQQNQQNR